ncbi:unnamed protein product, partial [Polarella glacialis]
FYHPETSRAQMKLKGKNHQHIARFGTLLVPAPPDAPSGNSDSTQDNNNKGNSDSTKEEKCKMFYQCPTCMTGFAKFGKLQKHLEEDHPGMFVAPFQPDNFRRKVFKSMIM